MNKIDKLPAFLQRCNVNGSGSRGQCSANGTAVEIGSGSDISSSGSSSSSSSSIGTALNQTLVEHLEFALAGGNELLKLLVLLLQFAVAFLFLFGDTLVRVLGALGERGPVGVTYDLHHFGQEDERHGQEAAEDQGGGDEGETGVGLR